MKKVPELRLKGFEEEWKEKKLDELADFSKGQGYSKGDLCQRGNTPIILYGRMYTNYETIIKNVDTFVNKREASVISDGNEVIVPASGETAEDISIASAVKQKGIILGGDLNILKPHEDLLSSYLALNITNSSVHSVLSAKAQGKSIVHLHNEDLKSISIIYPCINEQQSIGNFFQALDNLLAEQQNKLENLQKVKKSMLSKMFPKEGQKVPEIRFKGFDGDWEKKTLGEIANFYQGTGLTKEQIKINGKNQCILYGEIYTKYNYIVEKCVNRTDSKDGTLSKRGDVIMPGSTTTIGIDLAKAISIHESNIHLSGDIIILRNKGLFYSDFLAITLSEINRERISEITQGTTIVHLHGSQLKYVNILIPKTISEQKVIANYFLMIQRLSRQINKNIKLLNNLKQSFLAKMFV